MHLMRNNFLNKEAYKNSVVRWMKTEINVINIITANEWQEQKKS